MSIDLHTHSTASDGTDTPAELMTLAAAAGVLTVGLTDHDTTAGWAAASAALPRGLTLLPGAELSCEYERPGGERIPMHLLAYGFNASDTLLAQRLDVVRVDRVGRAERIVQLMRAGGLPVSWSQVEAFAAGGTVGRPHIARALVEAGVVGSVNEAFAGPVSSRSAYYVPKADIPVLEAIELVRTAGGVCVFAHPLRRGRHVGDEGIAVMAAAGLRGLEVEHPDHDQAARTHLAGIANELGLVRTGSSDYHGHNKTTPIAVCSTDPAQLERLIDPIRAALRVG